MGSDKTNIALRRKAEVGRQEHQARAMSVAKALRLSAAKVADTALDLSLTVIGLTSATCPHARLPEHVIDGALLMMLEGPQGRVGAAWADCAFVTGIIQQQTIGKVLEAQEGEERPLTATDAAMCAPFIDALFERACGLPETEEERDLLAGYRFGIRVDEARLMMMALEAPTYEVLALTFDLDGGRRQGRLTLCLPVGMAADLHVVAPVAESGLADAKPIKTLENNVLGLKVDLPVAVARLHVPLADVIEFEVGQLLPLSINSLDDVLVGSATGHILSRGALGQIEGMRAVRLFNAESDGQKRRASDEALLEQSGFDGLEAHADLAFSPTGDDLDAVDLPSYADPETGMLTLPETDDLPELAGELPPLADLDLPAMDGLDLPDLPDIPKMGTG